MTKPARQSNFELLRLVAMLLVLGVHANFLQHRPVTADFQADWLGWTGVTLLQAVCLVCVNVFVLISGWFGIRAKSRSVWSFVFVVVFWRWIIAGVALTTGQAHINAAFAELLVPGAGDWFTVAYAFLLLMSPMLNAFADTASKRTMGRAVATFFAVEFVFGFLIPASMWKELFAAGYNGVSLMGLYLLARYIRLHCPKLPTRLTLWGWLGIFALMAVINTAIFSVGTAMGAGAPSKAAYHYFSMYISPLVIVQSVSLLLAFSRLSFSSKMINSVARCAFAVYLIHMNPYVFPWFSRGCELIKETCGCAVVPATIGYLIAVMAACLLLDSGRLWLWNKLYKPKNDHANPTPAV